VPLVIDAYHALGAFPFRLAEQGLEGAYVLGGGYKYLQLGEGNCMLRIPPGSLLRPLVTGWFAEFEMLPERAAGNAVRYPPGSAALAGSTYDPTSHYRAARVFDFFREMELDDAFLRSISQHQVALLARRFDALDIDPAVVARPPVELGEVGGFLALRAPHAGELARALVARGVAVDSRGAWLRLGPAPYLCDAQLETAIDVLGEVARQL
jgi:kynureninase